MITSAHLCFLIFLHYLGDFPLQGQFLAENKGNNDYLLFAHSFIWAGTISVGMYYLGIFSMLKAVFLFGGHFIIDRWKARKHGANNVDLMIDQFLHFVQIVIVTF